MPFRVRRLGEVSTDMSRLAAIGLDAMEWTLMERLLDEGALPNLAELRGKSAVCRLDNVVAYRSELPWTLFLTGRRPSENRYWSTVEFDPATYETAVVGALPAHPFFAVPGVKTVAFDVPHTVPSTDVDGVQVLAWGAHSPQYPRASVPAGLLREIDEIFGPHPAFDNDYDGSWYVPGFLDKLAEALLTGASRRLDVVEWLRERVPDWDLLITVMSEPHSGGHHFWHGVDPTHPLAATATAPQAREHLLRVYKAVDAAVGRFAAGLPDDTNLVVFAVHGMQTNTNDLPSLALLPELLHRLHFGRSLLAGMRPKAWRRGGTRPIEPDPVNGWITLMCRQFADGPFERLERDVSGRLPGPVVDALARLKRRLTGRPDPRPPSELRDRIPPETDLTLEEVLDLRQSLAWQIPTWYSRFWPQMRAFALPTFSDAHVRINLAGRERDGVVPVDDYERACDEVEAAVRACTDPRTGRPAVADVLRVRADDPMDPHGPDGDLVVLWSGAIDAIEHPEAGLVGPFPFNRTGEHSSNGFAFFSGPGIQPADLGTRSAYDLTPTLVSLLGRTPAADLAGTSILAPLRTV